METGMRRIISCVAVFFALFFVSGCDSKVEDGSHGRGTAHVPTGAAPQAKRVALVMKTLTNPFFVEMERGARKAEKEMTVRLIVKTGAQETSIEQQIAIVEDLIADKVDAIVIAPGSSVELIPVLKKAQDARIPIVNIDNRLDPAMAKQAGLAGVPFVSVDNVAGAYLSAKYVCDRVTTPTKAAILEGIRVASNARDRKEGAVKAFNEKKLVELVASETANWKIDEAFEVTKKIFLKHPDIGILFCSNDMMALGAVHYLEQTKNQKVLVAAYDALDEAKKAIKEGKMAVTIDQQPAVQGYLGVKYACEMLQGRNVPPETMVDVHVVNGESLK
jgi:ribose transport system substrate-binding protein